MLMLLALTVPLPIVGLGLFDDDDGNTISEVGAEKVGRIEGEQRDDFIGGQPGKNVMNGHAGDETNFGCEVDDLLQGQDGNDMICSCDVTDVLTGNIGAALPEGQETVDLISTDDPAISGRSVDTTADITTTDRADNSVIHFGGTVLAFTRGTESTLTTDDIPLMFQDGVETLFDPNPIAA